MQSYWEVGTYSNSGIELYTHIYIKSVKHKAAHHQSKLTLKFYLMPILYDQAIRPRVEFVYIIEAHDIFRGKDDIDRLAYHDNRLDNVNQIKLKTDLSASCKYM